MKKISNRSLNIPQSPHRIISAKMEELKRAGKKTYNFTQGQPGLPPDEELIRLTYEHALKNSFDHFRYLPSQGLPELRKDISEELKRDGGIEVDPKNIVITEGGIEGLNLTFYAVADQGDEVFYLDPSYSVYWDLAKMYGLRVTRCPQRIEDGFQPDQECIKEKISRRTAAILITSPDNPTSRVLSEDTFRLIADLAIDNDVWLMYDEAYKYVIYEGSHVWIHKYSRTIERLISLNTFSKDIAIPGLRLGYLFAPDELVREVVKLKGITSISSNTSAQWMAHIALSSGIKKRYLEKVLPIYRKRRDVAYESVMKYLPEARVMKPNAGMYLFVDIRSYLSKLGIDDVAFANSLAEEAGVGVLPGSIFGEAGKGHIRLCFVILPEDAIEEGIKKIGDYFNKKS